MRKPLVLTGIVILTAVASTGEAPRSSQLPLRAPQAPPRAAASYGKLPIHFEANQGQTDDQVKFLARGNGYGLFLTSTESVLVLRKAEPAPPGQSVPGRNAAPPKPSGPPESGPRAVLRMKLLGADPRPAVEGREELPGKSNYFIGSDPKKWRTNVAQYARVQYKDVYPGVSLTYYGSQSQLEYDFVIAPGADPSRIRLGIEGAEEVRIDADGNLILSLPGGEVVEKAPVVYQEVDGARKAVEGRFVVTGTSEVGFEVGAYDADRPLVLDPLLVYSTYLGGNGEDDGLAIAVDASGNAYVTGRTSSTNFPTANPVQATNLGGTWDVFVLKMNAAGSALVYSTYLGGSVNTWVGSGGDDEGRGIAVDVSGNAYITGDTNSTDFPTVNALQAARGPGFLVSNAFVAKLNSSGSLVYSTYLGGSSGDFAHGIAVDPSGNAYVAGGTGSTDFPTVNPLPAARCQSGQVFVSKLNPAGSALAYSTCFGGSGGDSALGIAVDVSGNAYIAGITGSTDFPTANPLQPTSHGDYDGFVAKLNPAGSALVYSTYFGGFGTDYVSGIAVDASGNAYLTGSTTSWNLPTANPFQANFVGPYQDAFVAKLNAAGSALVYSTYLSGGSDRGSGIAVDAAGNAYVVGDTRSTFYPTARPLQAKFGGDTDVFVTALNPSGSSLVYSTYLGGSGDDEGFAIAVDASGSAYVTGYTSSTPFPTANPLQPVYGGSPDDAFLAKIDAHLADLSITKSDGQTTAAAGSPVTYTITVTNGGPTPVTGATVTDTFPAALMGVTWTCSPSPASTCGVSSGSGNINQKLNLLPGGTATFSATGTLDINASGGTFLTNTAAVTPPAAVPDPNLANNSATDKDSIIPAANLSITKTDGLTAVSPGQPVTYTIVASNAGPTGVAGATVADAVPAALTASTWTCVGASGGICAAAGTGDINDAITLPMGATVTYTLLATAGPTASTFSNTATITAPATVSDLDLANNTATDSDIVPCGNVVVVVPDGRLTDITVADGATAWFGAALKIGSSYSVEFKHRTAGIPPGALTVLKGDDSCRVSTLAPNDTSTIDPAGTGGTTRASFTATGTETFYQVRLDNTTGGPVALTFRWSETSLFSPAWSTNGLFNTYYSFQNTTGADLGGRLTLFDLTGGVLTTFDLSVPAGQTVSTNTASLGVTRSRTGTAKFTHDGPPGSFVVEAAIANFTINPAYVQPVKFQATREAR